MAAKTSTRRKPAAKSSSRRGGRNVLGIAGWIATAALGIGWLAPHGKAFFASHDHALPDISSLSISALWPPKPEPGVTGSIHPASQTLIHSTAAPAPDRLAARPDPIADEIGMAARLPMPRQKAIASFEAASPTVRVSTNGHPAFEPSRAFVAVPTMAPRSAPNNSSRSAYITGRQTEMRAYPFTTAQVLAVLPAHQRVMHLSGDGIWRRFKVVGSNAIGWIQIPDLMELSSSSNPAPTSTIAQTSSVPPAAYSKSSSYKVFPTPAASVPNAR